MEEALDTADIGARRADLMLLRRAVAGDPRAVPILVRRLIPIVQARVRRVAARSGLDRVEEVDLAQEAWLALVDRGGALLLGFDPARGASLEGYVGMITEREVGNVLQKQRAMKRGGAAQRVSEEHLAAESSEVAGPEEAVSTDQLAERLGAHLTSVLPPRGMLIFRLLFTDQHAPQTVAQMLGVTPQVVYNWQHRIRRAARDFIEAESGV